MALWGFLQGLIVGVLSLAGFAVGAIAGARLAPLLLSEGSHSPYAPLFALLGAIILGGILAMGLESLGFKLRGLLIGPLGIVDSVGGAILLGAVGLGVAWLFGAVALQTPRARQPVSIRHRTGAPAARAERAGRARPASAGCDAQHGARARHRLRSRHRG